jgi:hypothetical protein
LFGAEFVTYSLKENPTMTRRLHMLQLQTSSLSLRQSTHLLAFEWAGCILGLVGAFLLATNSTVSAYGWFAFLAANLAMIAFASGIQARGLLLQQIGFLASSCLGIYRAWG